MPRSSKEERAFHIANQTVHACARTICAMVRACHRATERTRSFWAWGFEEQFPDADERQILSQSARGSARGAAAHAAARCRAGKMCACHRPRLPPPVELAAIADFADRSRALHCYGKSFPDQLRAFALQFTSPPDFVLYPRDEEGHRRCLRACAAAGVAVVPFGGGTSVVAGVECPLPSSFAERAALDLARLDRVLEIDPTSRAARIKRAPPDLPSRRSLRLMA